MISKIHIGKIIKEKMSLQEMSVTDFAEKINCTPRNVYKIFGKPSIDTGLLSRINFALGLNLFLFYLTPEEIQNARPDLPDKNSEFSLNTGFITGNNFAARAEKAI